MSSTIILKATGLQSQPNQLELSPGSLTVANNVNIDRDNTIEKRRGFKLYGSPFGSTTDIAKQIMQYQNQLIVHYNNKLAFDDGTGNFINFPGTFLEQQPGLRIKSVASNNNLYFTTANGVQKISSLISDLSTAVLSSAGGVKATDISGVVNYKYGDSAGFLPQDSAVSYRVVWGIKDPNQNLILGSPSPPITLYNYLTPVLINDFNVMLSAVDSASLLQNTQNLPFGSTFLSTFGLPNTSSAQNLLTNMEAFASTLDVNLFGYTSSLLAAQYTSPATVTAATYGNGTAGTPAAGFQVNTYTITSPGYQAGDVITVSGIVAASPNNYNGTFTVLYVDNTGKIIVNASTNSGTYTSGGSSVKLVAAGAAFNAGPPSTITFAINPTSSSIPIAPGDQIIVTGVIPATYDATYTVVSTNPTLGTITVALPTGMTNPGIYISGGTIHANAFSAITQPAAPSAIPTDQELVAIQQYMLDIIAKLQTFSLTSTTYTAASVSHIAGPTYQVTYTSPTNFFPGEFIKVNLPGLPSPEYVQVLTATTQGTVITANFTSPPTTGAVVGTFLSNASQISDVAANTYFSGLTVTTTADVTLTISIPQEVINAGVGEYFLQIYRSDIVQAIGAESLTLLTPNDEMKLVYEAFPTQAELNAGKMIVVDNTPPAFAGAFLYTNANSGEGILQANALPPFAIDIARYKNVMFYANTRTKLNLTISLVGIQKMINDALNNITPKITISNGTQSVTYSFANGVKQVQDVNIIPLTTPTNYSYFDIFDIDGTPYRFYFFNTSTVFNPLLVPSGTNVTQIPFNPSSLTTLSMQIASIISTAYPNVFTASYISNTVFRITNVKFGLATVINTSTTNVLTAGAFTPGVGQTATQVLLSNSLSPAQAIDQTTRSLINIINNDPNSPVYAFYLSSTNSIPGQILLEARTLTNDPFYVVGNNANTGNSFNPTIGPSNFITAITPGNPTIITSVAHGLSTNSTVIITSSNSPTNIDGEYKVIVIDANTFSIPVNTSLMTPGSYTAAFVTPIAAEFSQKATFINRIYYSKYQQPEAVPIVNYLDVGDSDKAIIRIFTLRDSLFVFKEEGIYRISGETAPFALALFDSSCRIIASDSLGTAANVIFVFTKKGIETVSESGTSLISRPLEDKLLKLSSFSYTHFNTATWGVGYESDKSYLLFTIDKPTDINSTIAYRYNTVTAAWTSYDKQDTCGLIKLIDDRLYLGAADTDYIEQERKLFDRTDFADRQFTDTISFSNITNDQLRLSSVTNYKVGDVVVQTQNVTIYTYNTLLTKLFADIGYVGLPGLALSEGADLGLALTNLATVMDATGFNYSALIASSSGSVSAQTVGGLAVHITSTAHGLTTGRFITITGNTSSPSINGTFQVTVIDANTFSIPVIVNTVVNDGVWTTDDSSFLDIQERYNLMIAAFNVDPILSYNNYMPSVTTSSFETIITAVNTVTNTLTLDEILPYIVGEIIVYKAITHNIQYGPMTMGDPLSIKHFREATYMFENKAFTTAIGSFSTDLLPASNPVPFKGDGNGIYGNKLYGSGFYGGLSNAAPFRTYIPRNAQRCRYINVEFSHSIAREAPVLYGVTITGENTQSTRGYRR